MRNELHCSEKYKAFPTSFIFKPCSQTSPNLHKYYKLAAFALQIYCYFFYLFFFFQEKGNQAINRGLTTNFSQGKINTKQTDNFSHVKLKQIYFNDILKNPSLIFCPFFSPTSSCSHVIPCSVQVVTCANFSELAVLTSFLLPPLLNFGWRVASSLSFLGVPLSCKDRTS